LSETVDVEALPVPTAAPTMIKPMAATVAAD
jgi:hypothetical protein